MQKRNISCVIKGTYHDVRFFVTIFHNVAGKTFFGKFIFFSLIFCFFQKCKIYPWGDILFYNVPRKLHGNFIWEGHFLQNWGRAEALFFRI